MKKILFFLLLLAGVILLVYTDTPMVTESPPYYTVEAHPIEDTAHVIVVNR